MIETQNLEFGYGDSRILNGISLTIPDEEVLLIVGPNGSGKTTLVKQFNGLLEPDAGRVIVDGTAVTTDPLAARRAVGMVFQHPRDQFVATTVGADVAFGPENLGLPRADIDRRVKHALETVGLTESRTRRIDELSGGEQARVAIAGALAMEPSHLVLDEPFAGLDWPARQSIQRRLAALATHGISIIIVTHDLRDLAGIADRIVALDEGTIIDRGPLPAVRETLGAIGVHVPTSC